MANYAMKIRVRGLKSQSEESLCKDMIRGLIHKGIRLSERFPTIYTMLKERGYDPEKQPIPITPASHYFIGGVEVDCYGKSTLPGLYAVGECACTGVHGANRLASNSLMEERPVGNRIKQ